MLFYKQSKRVLHYTSGTGKVYELISSLFKSSFSVICSISISILFISVFNTNCLALRIGSNSCIFAFRVAVSCFCKSSLIFFTVSHTSSVRPRQILQGVVLLRTPRNFNRQLQHQKSLRAHRRARARPSARRCTRARNAGYHPSPAARGGRTTRRCHRHQAWSRVAPGRGLYTSLRRSVRCRGGPGHHQQHTHKPTRKKTPPTHRTYK